MKILITLISLVTLILIGSVEAQAILGMDAVVANFSSTALVLGSSYYASMHLKGSLFMAATTDVDAIAKWAGKFSKVMLNQMLNGLDVLKDLKSDLMVTRHGKLMPKFTAYGGMRPLDVEVEENGAAERKWSGRKLFVKDMMKLFKITPEEEGLLESFMSDMIQPGAKEIPFAQWVWQREMEKLASEINDNFYLQEYNSDAADWDAGTAYAVDDYVKFSDSNFYKALAITAAAESPISTPAKWTKVNHLVSFDGPAKIIADEITGANITPIVTGALTSANALTKIELMYNAMPVAHQTKGGKVRMSPDIYKKYLDHEKTVYPQVLDQNMGDGKKYIYGSGKKWEIVQCTWMGTSGRVIFDLEGSNLIVGTNVKDTPGVTNTIQTLHGYKAVAKWLFGFEIADLEVLYVNDVA